MARNDDLSIRLNAQANLTNIDGLKKDLEKVMSNINLDKGVESSLSKILKQMSGLEKTFENISKKDIFNIKDIDTVAKKTQELQNLMKNTYSILDGISMDTIIKSGEQYKKLMEDINKQTAELKKNFKESTGLDYDKEIQGINNLKNNINELKNAKEQLKQNGASLEYQKLLEQQNVKLDEQRQKLQNLKQLQSEIVAYQNQMAQNKGFLNYEELRKIATTRGNKAEFTNNKMLEAEQQEIKRLTAEYAEFEKQLKRIETYKNQASKTRGLKKLAEQLGIDKTSFQDIDKAIKQMQELVNVTAKNNVQGNSGLKKQISDIYAETVRARNAAKEYVAEIERGANAKITTNATTNIKTTTGLNNEIANISALLGAANTEEANDSLLVQAEQQNTNAINNLDSKIQQMVSLFNTLQNTMNAIFGIEGMEKDFLDSSAKSLQNIDNDTTTIIGKVDGTANIKDKPKYNEKVNSVIETGEENANKLLSMNLDYNKIQNTGLANGRISTELDFLIENIKKIKENSVNGAVNKDKTSDMQLIEVQASILKIKNIIDKSLPTIEQDIGATQKTIETKEQYIKVLQDGIKMQQNRVANSSVLDTKTNNGQMNIYQTTRVDATNKINEGREKLNTEQEGLVKTLQQLEAYKQSLEYIKNVKESMLPVLENEHNANMDIEKAIQTLTQAQAALLNQEDQRKRNQTEQNNNTNTTIQNLEEERVQLEANKKAEEEKLRLQQETKQRIDATIESLKQQTQQLQQNSATAKTFNETFGQIGKTLGTYISLNYMINKVIGSIRKGISVVEEMDASITQIGIVTGKTSQEVWSSFSTYNAQAKRLNTTTTELLEATKLYYQQGLNTAEVNEMVEATAVAAALGEVQMGEAANTLTAIMNGYGMAATQAMEVTDKISAVGADSAADFGELSTAIEKVASSAATAGIDLDHLLGYIGKMVEVTREAPTNIGSAMKTIVARMAEIKADPDKALEDGTDFNKVQTALKTVGIELTNTSGEMRALDDVLDELGGKWNNLSRNSKAYLATIIAGNRQQSRFLALMNDYDRTMELVASSTDSAGRSSEQFRNYATGVEASLNRVKAEAEGFYASLTSGNGAIKGVYNLFADFLKLLNQLGPVLSTLGVTTTAFFAKWRSNINSMKRDKITEIMRNNIANNMNLTPDGKLQTMNTSDIFINKKTPKTKAGQFLQNNFTAQGIFNKNNGKQLTELNKIIEVYNNGISDSADLTQILNGVNQSHIDAIKAIKTNEEKTLQQSVQLYIQRQKETLGVKSLTTSMWANVAAQAAMTVGITLIIAGATALISYLSDMNKKLREQTQASEEAAQKASDEANSLETLIKNYDKLKSKTELTTDEKEELQSINQQLINQFPDLLTGLDSEGKAYIKNTGALKDYLKQKEIEAAEKEKEAAEKRKELGQKTSNNAYNGFSKSKSNSEDAYNETHSEKIQKVQNLSEQASDLKNVSESKIELEYNHEDLGKRKMGLSFAGVVANIRQNSFDDLEKVREEVNNSDWSKEVKEYISKLINAQQELNQAAIDGAKEVDKKTINAKRKIELYNKDLDSDKQTMIQSIASTFSNDYIDEQTKDFKNDKEIHDWFEKNNDFLTKDLTNIITRAATGNNSDKIKEAYDSYIKAQSEGLSGEELSSKRNALFNLLKKSATSDKDKETLKQFYESQIKTAQGQQEDAVKQALGALKVSEGDSNYDEIYSALNNIFTKQNSTIRNKINESINEIMNNSDLFKGNESKKAKFTQNSMLALNNLFNDKELGESFQKQLNDLDINNAVDVKAFKEKWNGALMNFADQVGMSDEEKKLFVEKIIPNPGSTIENVLKSISDDMQKAVEINEQGFDDLFAGDYNLRSAIEDGFDLGEGFVVGENFVIDTSTVVDKMKEAYDGLKKHIEELKITAIESGQTASEELKKVNQEIQSIQLQAQNQDRDLTFSEKNKIEDLRKQAEEKEKIIQKASKELENAERLTNELKEQVRQAQLLSGQSFFNTHADEVNQTVSSLKDLASAYNDIKEGELTQLDIIEMIANNTDLLTAVYVNERGELALNKNALEELAKTRIKEAIAAGESRIQQLEQLKSMIKGEETYTLARRQDMENRVKQNEELEKKNEETVKDTETKLQGAASIWDSFVNGLRNNVLPAFGGFLSKLLGGLSTFKTKSNSILGKVANNISNVLAGVNSASNAGTDPSKYDKYRNSDGKIDLNKVIEDSKSGNFKLDNSSDDTTVSLSGGAGSNTNVEKWQNGGNYTDDGTGISGEEYIAQIDKQIAEIRAVNNKLQQMYDSGSILESINNMKSSGGSKDKSGKEFEAYMEYFEKFYNYVKRIQNIEAKINRLREKRNIIDANKNYYIEDLKKENELLAQQANIYNEYIGAQKNYLRDLRNQIASTYGDLAYFTDEGLLQLKVSEVWISSESQEDRIKEFQRLMEEYESQYETMQENETKLYEIQKTQLENITNMYDKLLQRLDDVRENLEFIQSISEHKITMAYGDLKTLDLLNDKLVTTIDLWKNAEDVVARLHGDMQIIQDQVNNSNLGQFLQWDKDLSQYRITDAFYDDLVRQEWESMGANWSEITTWVTTTAKKSEEIAEKTRDTTESLMDAEETLKSIVEDRLSKIESVIGGWTGEITKLFDLISRTTDLMGTKQEVFGTTTGSLQEEYDAVVAAGALAKRTYEDLKNKQKDLLSEITSMYGQYITVNEYGAAINETAIRESTKLTEAEKAELAEIAATYNLIQEASQEAEDTMYDNYQKRIELEERKRDAIIEIQNQLHDMLMEQDQKELDDLQKKYDEMSKLDNEYYSKLQQKIQDARNAREDRQSQIQTDQLRAQIALAQKDNTSQYNQQLIDLQKQLNEQLQAQADAEIDRELERIEREQQEREEDREMQIQQLENLITFKDENSIYWQESQAIFNQGMSETLSRLAAWNEEQNASEIQKATTLEGYVSNAHQAFVDYSKIEFDKIDAQSAVVGKIQQMMIDFHTGKVKIDDEGINNALGSNSNFLGAKVQTMTDYLNQNLGGLQDALNEVKDSRETLWWLLRKIYNKIYNPNDSSYFVETGIASSGGSGSSSGNSNNGGSSSGSGGSGSGDGIARIGDVVTYSGQYYYDSFGRRPAGSVYSGRSGAVIIDNYSATKYGGSGRNTGNYDVHIKSADGRYSNLGWVKLSQLSGYKKGGYVDFTGPAMVHGTKNAPEAFLNSRQTALFENLRDTLVDNSKTTRKSSETKENNTEKIEVGEVNVHVQEIADMGTLIKDSIDQMKQEIMYSINKQTAMRVRR